LAIPSAVSQLMSMLLRRYLIASSRCPATAAPQAKLYHVALTRPCACALLAASIASRKDFSAYYSGVVFELKPNPDRSWTESVLYSFTGAADGAHPSAGLVLNGAGNLYGTTFEGGACAESDAGCGVVFKLAPDPAGTWTESVVHSFTGGADGAAPSSGLVFDSTGNLYGTTAAGGADGYGVVFKLTSTSSGWSESVLHTFMGSGKYPEAPVIFDRAGNLYGTTLSGSTNSGVVFEITR